MRFITLDAQIAQCEEHLRATGMANSEVEFYFTQFLLVRICAEFETRINRIFEIRCARSNDLYVRSFYQKSARTLVKKYKLTDIYGYVRKFGAEYETAFRILVDQELETEWEKLYTNRHGVAHATGVQLTLLELKETYFKCKEVLEAIAMALELRPAELRNVRK
jgi:hypothetical protein